MTSQEILNTRIKSLMYIPSLGKWKVSVSHSNGTNYGFKLTGTGTENDTILSDMIYDHLRTVTLETLPTPGTPITRNTSLIDEVPTEDR